MTRPVATPDTLGGSSLAAWFEADAIAGFADGASLTTWTDSSSVGNTLSYSAGGTAPKYRATGGPLGLPCVDHTVAAGGLNRSSATGMPAGDYTYFMVVQSGSTAIQSLMNGGVSAANHPQIRLNNLKIELDKSGVASIETSTAGLTSNTWTIVIATFTSVGSVVHFDIGGTTEDYSVGGTTSFATGDLAYGNYQNSSNFFNGKMAEIGLYSSVLSSGDLTSLEAYLTAKWVTGIATIAVSLTATSTLSVASVVTDLPIAALTATSTLTTSAATAISGVAALTAASTLTTAATDIVPAIVVLVASSTLVATADAGAIDLGAVSLSAGPVLTAAMADAGAIDLGAVGLSAGPVLTAAMAQPGTLANPYAAADSDTRSIDFASALFVATEPVAITGPPAAPSVWYEFTESQVADWLASTSGFANGAVIELYAGPPGAGPDDLTFIATDGQRTTDLGAVTLSALVTTVATSLRVEVDELGAVGVAASPVVAMALT